MFIQVLSGVGVLFILILIGIFSKLNRIISDELTSGLSKIVLVVTLPFLYFYTLATESSLKLFKTAYILPLFAMLFVLISYLAGFLAARLLKLKGDKRNTFLYLTAFTNCGFLAIPIANAVFGQAAVVQVIIFNLGFNLLYWTLGVWTLSEDKYKNPFGNLINSGTISMFFGLLIGLMALKLPKVLMNASKLLGDVTIPLAMIVVGTIIADFKKFSESSSFSIIGSLVLCRLFISPIIALIVLQFVDLPFMTKSVIMLQATMPSASTTPMFTRRFGGDPHLASSGVFFTTLISVVTIPLFMSLIK